MIPAAKGGITLHQPDGERMSIYDAAVGILRTAYRPWFLEGKNTARVQAVIGLQKGTQLLGVKAVIAKSFERIHRSNLVGMGVLPLQFREMTALNHWASGR